MRFAENHDLSTVAVDKPFDEVKAEPCQSVAVGNHKFELMALQAAFQYGLKPFAFEVEAAGNVGDDFGIWLLRLEIGHLSLQSVGLFSGTDAGIHNNLRVPVFPNKGFNVKQTLTGRRADGRDSAIIRILSQRVGV